MQIASLLLLVSVLLELIILYLAIRLAFALPELILRDVGFRESLNVVGKLQSGAFPDFRAIYYHWRNCFRILRLAIS